jgi:acetoin utilization deacetylase AcuC-like enzyme
MVADSGSYSPSAAKPRQVTQDWQGRGLPITVECFLPMTRDELATAHCRRYVDDVLDLLQPNGHGNCSEDVAQSLPWTTGSMVAAALAALETGVACSPSSGFHHAGYDNGGAFCTFNGLMVAAVALLDRGCRVCIIDADAHYGDGTDEILDQLELTDQVLHWTYGRRTLTAEEMFEEIDELRSEMNESHDWVVLYRAGADPHVDDPLGGYLTTEEMRQRDRYVFQMCKGAGIPLAWNLAGGYQREPDGSIPIVLELRGNTMQECCAVFLLILKP